MTDTAQIVTHVQAAQASLQSGASAENVLTEFFNKILAFFEKAEPEAAAVANVAAAVDPAIVPEVDAGEAAGAAAETLVKYL
jgi:hypothetical protein